MLHGLDKFTINQLQYQTVGKREEHVLDKFTISQLQFQRDGQGIFSNTHLTKADIVSTSFFNVLIFVVKKQTNKQQQNKNKNPHNTVRDLAIRRDDNVK